MAMKADFELEFSSDAEAKKAFAVLQKDLKTIKGTLKSRLAGKKILATAESDSFAGLRAMSNSFLRSARITYDVIDAVAGRARKKAVEEENDSID
ncbi:MAG: KEOPS complex subunit Pcc1 [Candidatus Micrarchaeia archaeon]|jgi:tRNA threonylcarbamoyladenosine modification (KEOPS) complex  Pcc1 subunit